MDPRQQALVELDALLASVRELRADECLRLVELVALVPGRMRTVAEALAAQRRSAAVSALMLLPAQVPGVVEGLFQAIHTGVSRRRVDDSDCVRLLALDFCHSRARTFDELLRRSAAVFGSAFERFTVGSRAMYRFTLQEGRGTLAGRVAALAHEIQWLHPRLARLRGARLWINGWCFASEGPFGPAIQVHLVRAWLGWAASQTTTRAR